MKIRYDFVSNSSSSSFIVKADPGVPDIFLTGEKYGFDRYVEDNLRRDVFECFESIGWGWYSWQDGEDKPLLDRIRIVPDSEFADAYSKRGIADFTLPECCRKYAWKICDSIEKVLDIEAERQPKLWEDGKRSRELNDIWQREKLRKTYEEKDKFDEVLNEARAAVAEILKPVMGGWEFYCTELEDSNANDSEERGYDAIRCVSWYRIFNNH